VLFEIRHVFQFIKIDEEEAERRKKQMPPEGNKPDKSKDNQDNISFYLLIDLSFISL